MSRSLYAHQQQALNTLPSGGAYLAFEQGLGKTLTAIRYARKHGLEKILVVSPAVALGVWEDELAQEGIQAVIPTGTRKQKATLIVGNFPVVINYEVLLEPTVEKAIRRWGPDLIILDEAQKIKNAQAKRSKVLHRLGKDFPVLALSGTPISKNLLDLYSQYKTIDSTIWGGISWTKFKYRYALWGGYGGYQLMGYQRTDELLALIEPYTLVARKEDTLDLPEKTHQLIPVPLGADAVDYGKMARTGVAGDWVTTNPMEKLLRLSQITGRSKVSATSEVVTDLVESGEQVVVYYRFRADGAALSETLGVSELNGDTSADGRKALVADFQAGREAILLAQIQAGSTAITLTSASYMVYHSLSYAYEDWAQSQDRIHRIGQHDPCNYYYMVAVGPKGGITVDQLVLNALQNKEDVASMVTANPDLLLKDYT